MGALVGAPFLGTLICWPTQKPSRSGSGVFIFIGAWLPLYRHGWLYHCMCVLSCSVMSDSLSPPGSSVHEIFQARILEWVAISFSRGSSWPRDWTYISCISRVSRQILYHCATWKAGLYPWLLVIALNLQSSPLPPSQGTGWSLNLTKMWSFGEKLFWKPKPWCSEFHCLRATHIMVYSSLMQSILTSLSHFIFTTYPWAGAGMIIYPTDETKEQMRLSGCSPVSSLYLTAALHS